VGVTKTDKLVEVQRPDLVGEYVGHTGPKVRHAHTLIGYYQYCMIFIITLIIF
jgi:AAA+ superfamily predicted ATPase